MYSITNQHFPDGRKELYLTYIFSFCQAVYALQYNDQNGVLFRDVYHLTGLKVELLTSCTENHVVTTIPIDELLNKNKQAASTALNIISNYNKQGQVRMHKIRGEHKSLIR